MRKPTELNKTSQKKILKFIQENPVDDSEFNDLFKEIITWDVRKMRDCAEHDIVDTYLRTASEMLEATVSDFDDEWYERLKKLTRMRLAKKYTAAKTFDNNIDIYFNAVKREYILHPMGESDELEFMPENKDIFIKNNLKLVIECAKRYRNFGIPFDDLIQSGNMGLLTAFERFDTNRANLRFAIIEDINASALDSFTSFDAADIISKNFTYSKLLEKTLAKVPKSGFIDKESFIVWANENINKACFSSIAFAWTRAMIISEINKYGKIIKMPNSAYVPEDSTGQKPGTIIRLDAINPHTDDVFHDNQIAAVANEEFAVEDESIEDMEHQDVMKGLLDKLMNSLDGRSRRILKKRFGIDAPIALSIAEIAESESMPVAKVKLSIAESMRAIDESLTGGDRELLIDMLG